MICAQNMLLRVDEAIFLLLLFFRTSRIRIGVIPFPQQNADVFNNAKISYAKRTNDS